jgi:hypothetical protein
VEEVSLVVAVVVRVTHLTLAVHLVDKVAVA